MSDIDFVPIEFSCKLTQFACSYSMLHRKPSLQIGYTQYFVYIAQRELTLVRLCFVRIAQSEHMYSVLYR